MPRPVAIMPVKDGRKKEWVHWFSHHTTQWGRVFSKCSATDSVTVIHWIPKPDSIDILQLCSGCHLGDKRLSSSRHSPLNQSSSSIRYCLIRKPRSELLTVTAKFTKIDDSYVKLGVPISVYHGQSSHLQFNGEQKAEHTIIANPDIEFLLFLLTGPNEPLAIYLATQLQNNIDQIIQEESTSHFKFYTDGSLLIKTDNGISAMGAGWVNCSSQITGNFALKEWPSSTKAELAAILAVLLIILSNSNIIIMTDSQAAIDGINVMLRKKHLWKWTKATNSSLKTIIYLCLEKKNLNLNLIKVKGHSGELFNDVADAQAKMGLTQVEII